MKIRNRIKYNIYLLKRWLGDKTFLRHFFQRRVLSGPKVVFKVDGKDCVYDADVSYDIKNEIAPVIMTPFLEQLQFSEFQDVLDHFKYQPNTNQIRSQIQYHLESVYRNKLANAEVPEIRYINVDVVNPCEIKVIVHNPVFTTSEFSDASIYQGQYFDYTGESPVFDLWVCDNNRDDGDYLVAAKFGNDCNDVVRCWASLISVSYRRLQDLKAYEAMLECKNRYDKRCQSQLYVC